jgi:hypothetical protein
MAATKHIAGFGAGKVNDFGGWIMEMAEYAYYSLVSEDELAAHPSIRQCRIYVEERPPTLDLDMFLGSALWLGGLDSSVPRNT